jgi:hypothetical protein
MGWLFMPVTSMGGFASPKSYLDNQCTYAPDPETGRKKGLRVLASRWRGSAYYAAVQPYDADGNADDAFAIVCLVRWNPKARDPYAQFGYKDMAENMGPCETRCPSAILDLLGPPGNDYAAQWRTECRAWNALARRPRPKPGDTIILREPLKFTDGYEGGRFRVVARRKGIALLSPEGRSYRISRLMERPFTLIPAVATP